MRDETSDALGVGSVASLLATTWALRVLRWPFFVFTTRLYFYVRGRAGALSLEQQLGWPEWVPPTLRQPSLERESSKRGDSPHSPLTTPSTPSRQPTPPLSSYEPSWTPTTGPCAHPLVARWLPPAASGRGRHNGPSPR